MKIEKPPVGRPLLGPAKIPKIFIGLLLKPNIQLKKANDKKRITKKYKVLGVFSSLCLGRKGQLQGIPSLPKKER